MTALHHGVQALEKNRVLCTCGLWLEADTTWDALVVGSRHARDMES